MESVVELRARIGELGSAISRQKQALRDLEKTKSDAECQLNSILDPMERLPLEISSEIFMLCLPGSHVPHSISVPMVLLAICHAWSDIALSTPLLWTAIDIDSQRTSRFYKLFEVWLARARSLPLTLSLHGSMDPHIHALVKMHAHQVQNLELYIPSGEDLRQSRASFPALRTLKIAPSGPVDDDGFLTPEPCVEILRAAPGLLGCDFDDMYYEEGVEALDTDHTPLTHTGLLHLRIGQYDINEHHTSSALILQNLTLPALQSLTISEFDISHDDFLSFLTRSSPPLQSLGMQIPSDDWSSHNVNQYFRLLPGLKDLQVWRAYMSEDEDDPFPPFLDVLSSAPDFLPNLRTLTIWGYFPDRPQYENLVSLLGARGSEALGSFKLIFPGWAADPGPDADIVAALRQLVENGMDIHIGPEEGSFI